MLDEYGAGRLQSSRSWRKEIEKVKLVEKYVTRGRILDVGCGDARFLLALDARRWEAWGVEFNSPVVDMVAEAFPKLHLVAGDLFSRNLSPGSFDVVCFWHVLEHLPRPFDVLSQVAALLKPGGLVFVSLPNLESLQARLFRRFWYGFDDVPRHLHHFSPRVLAGLLSRVGLQVMDGPLFFCRIVNAHCLKHSLVNWSEGTFRSRVPYLLLKPFVLTLPALERMVRSYGIVTMVGRRG